MNLTVFPGNSLNGMLFLPGDKSISHRSAVFAAISEGTSTIHNYLFAGVTNVMLDGLRSLGVGIERKGSSLIIHGQGLEGLKPPVDPINCGNSATTMRLLAGLLAAAGIPAVLDGTESLRRRPMNRIVEPLQAMGVPIKAARHGTAPLAIESRSINKKLKPIEYSMPVASAQVKSCLLLASLSASGSSSLSEPGPSRNHTELMLNSFGIPVDTSISKGDINGESHTITLQPPGKLSIPCFEMTVPGDFSSAAFLIAAAVIAPGSHIELSGVGINPTRTGLLDAFCSMGAAIRIIQKDTIHNEDVGNISVTHGDLHATEVGGSLVVRMIDEFPAFAPAAAAADGVTRVFDASELRRKESDRISALALEFKTLGLDIDERDDGFSISGPCILTGGTVDPHKDHRLAMALAVSGAGAQSPITVQNAEIIFESFPGFIEDLMALGVSVETSDG